MTLIILINLLNWALKPTGTAMVRWQAPSKFNDLSLLESSEIESYKVQWSNIKQTTQGVITVPGNIFSYRIMELSADKYNISVTANSIYGTRSEESKTSILVK